ncbi:MAG: hypothetical protein HC838_16715 [Spirulinaceae cyanobacterium RM2_2_10]|nr:hypothetical protein [Spirulinaceae cyanobacterium SM2_1_0]NJO21345.1 hypothetical protein [Spirulinaceae cyanobacterium RM2_2_10]
MRYIHWQSLAMATALTIGILARGTSPSLAETIAIGSSWNQATQLSGQSGGPQATADCGAVAAAPNHVLSLAGDIPTMQVNVQATGGEPTLLIEGPGGQRWCALSMDGLSAKVSGYWEAGTYRVFVGDRTGSRHSYTLNINP